MHHILIHPTKDEDTNMSKKVKVTPVVTPEVIEVEVNEVMNEMSASVTIEQPEVTIIEEMTELLVTPVTPAQTPAQPTQQPKADITAILAIMPDTFTPATLDKLFQLNDGGKTVRRHLRKHFSGEMAHNLKDKWSFNKSGNQVIIEYFASRYAFDANALTTK